MKKVFIQDIAASLNLSRNTVSKALTNSESVSMDTRQKVVRKALEMGYVKIRPDVLQSLREENLNSTKHIAVIVHMEDTGVFWSSIVNGISAELARNQYNLLYCCITGEDENNLVIPPNILNRSVDGIIVLQVFSLQYIGKLIETGLPIIYLDAHINSTNSSLRGDIILIEGETGVYEITRYLIERGRKRLGFIGDSTSCKTIYERWQGFQNALRDSGIGIDPDLCIVGKKERRYYAYEEIKEALDNIKKMPEAFVCANDSIAIHTFRYFKANGFRIPEDIAISGFDDTRECMIVDPQLTSVHIDNAQIGKRLAEEMLWRINNPEHPYETVRISSEVKFRGSTDI